MPPNPKSPPSQKPDGITALNAPAKRSFFDLLPDSAYVRQSQLVQDPRHPESLAPWPFSPATYWRKINAGTLPTPIKLSDRVSVQSVGECRAIIAAWAAGKADDDVRQLVIELHAKRKQLIAA